MKNSDNYDGDKYSPLIIPNCIIPADQAEDLLFISFACDSDTESESAFFTDDEPPEKANGVADRPMLAITTVQMHSNNPHMTNELPDFTLNIVTIYRYIRLVWKRGSNENNGSGSNKKPKFWF
ncbi:hypothetical protein CTI12_AA536320 [Artemisia annua]|uniref:Uncharacterized protein n=1 Tax=Artemisia annua TaxID=35608 RepID=A0A2U1KWI2_ARTAN|nr:hypothetical protein CTI12_AA536320 [Artemisia annua]